MANIDKNSTNTHTHSTTTTTIREREKKQIHKHFTSDLSSNVLWVIQLSEKLQNLKIIKKKKTTEKQKKKKDNNNNTKQLNSFLEKIVSVKYYPARIHPSGMGMTYCWTSRSHCISMWNGLGKQIVLQMLPLPL